MGSDIKASVAADEHIIAAPGSVERSNVDVIRFGKHFLEA
jgi:hypothetical protein